MPVEAGDTVTDRTERRHECGSDRHAGENRSFLFAREFQNAGYAAEEGDDNEALEDQPELINEDAYSNWIIKVELSDKSELGNLMDAKAYEAFCEK